MLRFTTSVLDPVEYAIHSIMEIIFNHFKKERLFFYATFLYVKIRFGNAVFRLHSCFRVATLAGGRDRGLWRAFAYLSNSLDLRLAGPDSLLLESDG